MILITGGAGYIGSHCALRLLEKGEKVIIFDNLSTGHIETIETLKKQGRLEFAHGDLKNKDDIERVFSSFNISTVLHFAGVSLVSESVKHPEKYYSNNVLGSLNLLEVMSAYEVRQIVFSSTAATYGEPKYSPIDETHPQEPVNPYGKSKLMVEKMLDDFDKTFGIRSVRLRYFNVAGADSKNRIGEWHDTETHLIPNILKSTFNNKETFQIYGNDFPTKDGTCVRDYINVEDLIDAHLLALDYLNNGGKTSFFNLGTNNGNSVKEIFFYCEKICNMKIPVEIAPRREGDPSSLIANSTKAHDILKWVPKRTLEDSIKSAYLWEKHLQETKTKC